MKYSITIFVLIVVLSECTGSCLFNLKIFWKKLKVEIKYYHSSPRYGNLVMVIFLSIDDVQMLLSLIPKCFVATWWCFPIFHKIIRGNFEIKG